MPSREIDRIDIGDISSGHTDTEMLERIRKNLEIIQDEIDLINDYDEITHTFNTANEEEAILHDLVRIPNRYRITKITNNNDSALIAAVANSAVTVYDGNTENTDKIIYLKSSQANVTVTLEIWAV